jgi:uncharacterized protein
LCLAPEGRVWEIRPVNYARHNAIFLFATILVLAVFFASAARAAFVWESIQLHAAVTDTAGILDDGQQRALEGKLRSFYDSTGNAFVLLTIPSLDGGDIDDAANRIFAKSGIGQKGNNRGLLVLVAVADRKMRIETGYGLEGELTDAICRSVIEADMVPAFRQGRYYDGINAAMERMMKIAQGDVSAVPKKEKNGFPVIFIVAIFIFFALVSIFGKRQSVRRGNYHGGSGPFIIGGGFGGFSGGGGGGGFGGFGGGMSGGGGAHGGW